MLPQIGSDHLAEFHSLADNVSTVKPDDNRI